MSFDFATVATQLGQYLSPLLPEGWLVQDADLPLGRSLGSVLTFSQGNVSTEVAGSDLPPGTVGVAFILILSTPETDPAKGWPHLNLEAPHLFRALDSSPQILWETAERAVLSSGESVYSVPITVLATIDNQE